MTARLSNPGEIRDWRRVWYGLSSWKKRRAHQLSEHPLCAMCEAQGRVAAATIADHVVSHVAAIWNEFRLGELQSLCTPRHDRKESALSRVRHVRATAASFTDAYYDRGV
jgi:hypothetical protein